MKKERLTIEEIQAMPKDAFPFTVTCDDDTYEVNLKTVSILSPVVAGDCIAVVGGNDKIIDLDIDSLSHYPSLKPEPNIKRFYERVGLFDWTSDDEQIHNGVCIVGVGCYSSRLMKTGRYFDWDIDANKIVGKVEVE